MAIRNACSIGRLLIFLRFFQNNIGVDSAVILDELTKLPSCLFASRKRSSWEHFRVLPLPPPPCGLWRMKLFPLVLRSLGKGGSKFQNPSFLQYHSNPALYFCQSHHFRELENLQKKCYAAAILLDKLYFL